MELINAKQKGIELLKIAEDQGAEKVTNYKIKTFASNSTNTQSKAKHVQQLQREETAVTRSLYFL